ncbi:ribonuclease HII-domain-containing protein [Protomyces lactucae-debilis]|uniref:Ribonuclease n=1 Tax=Protomyces lactucae-debilis TaxID=2754530 RepID=A0A1Y2F457_PROLT|nr:ribonuclease HII-domain-containing protein [Protomyces lactucae-debilis]ORY78659.1 ribonuclease HII-domain-containing protein [Protomyces lactucae-debilis]
MPTSVTCSQASKDVSYSYITPIPASITAKTGVECILGVDEAGRGPVLGPMVYGVAYCSVDYAESIKQHGFMDSKVLDHATRVDLLHKMEDTQHVLQQEIGWTVRVMSARDIAAGMLRPSAPYNLNAQAHDTTIQLIRDVLAQGVNVRQIFVDTVGIPEKYQQILQRAFPMAQVTVTKKADSLFPIVSVASICAKVTRDKALEANAAETVPVVGTWGSGYPGDARTVEWLKRHMHPIFGWQGGFVRYSWATAKDMLEGTSKHVKDKKAAVEVIWHDEIVEEVEHGQARISDMLQGKNKGKSAYSVERYFGKNATMAMF